MILPKAFTTKFVLIMDTQIAGSKGGDNGSNIQFLGVSDFGDWLKGNMQEFGSF